MKLTMNCKDIDIDLAERFAISRSSEANICHTLIHVIAVSFTSLKNFHIY
jgi:hypothetical protein